MSSHKKINAETALVKIVASLTCTVCLIGQCIEGMTVLGEISGRSFKLHKTCQSSV